MEIRADGTWYHRGGKIGRPAMVRAFASLLLRDAAGQEIYVWKAPPPKASLGKGETVYFRARLAAPPEAANAVRIQFADVTPATAKKLP